VFEVPVNAVECPAYFDEEDATRTAWGRPVMNFGLMEEKARGGAYDQAVTGPALLESDFANICYNAAVYNPPEHWVHKAALNMLHAARPLLQEFRLAVQGNVCVHCGEAAKDDCHPDKGCLHSCAQCANLLHAHCGQVVASAATADGVVEPDHPLVLATGGLLCPGAEGCAKGFEHLKRLVAVGSAPFQFASKSEKERDKREVETGENDRAEAGRPVLTRGKRKESDLGGVVKETAEQRKKKKTQMAWKKREGVVLVKSHKALRFHDGTHRQFLWPAVLIRPEAKNQKTACTRNPGSVCVLLLRPKRENAMEFEVTWGLVSQWQGIKESDDGSSYLDVYSEQMKDRFLRALRWSRQTFEGLNNENIDAPLFAAPASGEEVNLEQRDDDPDPVGGLVPAPPVPTVFVVEDDGVESGAPVDKEEVQGSAPSAVPAMSRGVGGGVEAEHGEGGGSEGEGRWVQAPAGNAVRKDDPIDVVSYFKMQNVLLHSICRSGQNFPESQGIVGPESILPNGDKAVDRSDSLCTSCEKNGHQEWECPKLFFRKYGVPLPGHNKDGELDPECWGCRQGEDRLIPTKKMNDLFHDYKSKGFFNGTATTAKLAQQMDLAFPNVEFPSATPFKEVPGLSIFSPRLTAIPFIEYFKVRQGKCEDVDKKKRLPVDIIAEAFEEKSLPRPIRIEPSAKVQPTSHDSGSGSVPGQQHGAPRVAGQMQPISMEQAKMRITNMGLTVEDLRNFFRCFDNHKATLHRNFPKANSQSSEHLLPAALSATLNWSIQQVKRVGYEICGQSINVYRQLAQSSGSRVQEHQRTAVHRDAAPHGVPQALQQPRRPASQHVDAEGPHHGVSAGFEARAGGWSGGGVSSSGEGGSSMQPRATMSPYRNVFADGQGAWIAVFEAHGKSSRYGPFSQPKYAAMALDLVWIEMYQKNKGNMPPRSILQFPDQAQAMAEIYLAKKHWDESNT